MTVFHMLKKLKEKLNIGSTDIIDVIKAHGELLDTATIYEMKTILDGFTDVHH